MKMSAFVRSMLALVAAVATAASAGSSSTSAAQAASQSGTAFVNLDFGGTGFPYVVENGVTGRNVSLVGDIQGTNFEPGTCHDNVGPDAVPAFLNCVVFGTGPGQFTRLAPGGVAFTTCHCSVGGVGDPDEDTVILKISYPPATPPQYPGGFTKFTFQHGTGALSGLHGQGTLDFGAFQANFTYRFTGQ